MPLGTDNPCAFRVGGGPTRVQSTYRVLRSAVGVGNSAEETGTAVEAWRRARARGLAAVQADRRVVLQGVAPDLATDLLPMYERLLGIVPGRDASEPSRRTAVAAAWTSDLSAVAVEEELQARVDASITVEATTREQSRDAQLGARAFRGDPTEEPPMLIQGGRSGPGADSFPLYSDDLVFYVRYPHDPGALPAASQRKIEKAKALLRQILPSWCSFQIFTHDDGFTLDLDLLDVTPL